MNPNSIIVANTGTIVLGFILYYIYIYFIDKIILQELSYLEEYTNIANTTKKTKTRFLEYENKKFH